MTTHKFKVERLRNKVRVKSLMGAWSSEITSREAKEITEWVEQSQMGRRVAYDMWQLDGKEAYLMFTLRWAV